MDRLYTCADISERYGVPIQTVWLWIRKKNFLQLKLVRSTVLKRKIYNLLKKQEGQFPKRGGLRNGKQNHL